MKLTDFIPDMPRSRVDLRLEDLREWHAVAIQCRACGHIGYVSPRTLRRRWAGDVRLQAIDHRMRCTSCRWRGGHAWSVVRVPRNH